jgi:hypothetical protein
MTACLGLSLAGVAGQGCGSTSSPPTPDAGAPDSGADVKVADSAPVDSSVMDTTVADTAMPACPVEASIENLMLPDASLGSDASVGTCLSCATANCHMEEVNCDMDCMCKEALYGVLNCIAMKTGSIITCAEMALGETNAATLGLCIYNSCKDECGASGFSLDGGGGMETSVADGPSEASETSTTDGPTEAAPVEGGEQ